MSLLSQHAKRLRHRVPGALTALLVAAVVVPAVYARRLPPRRHRGADGRRAPVVGAT